MSKKNLVLTLTPDVEAVIERVHKQMSDAEPWRDVPRADVVRRLLYLGAMAAEWNGNGRIQDALADLMAGRSKPEVLQDVGGKPLELHRGVDPFERPPATEVPDGPDAT